MQRNSRRHGRGGFPPQHMGFTAVTLAGFALCSCEGLRFDAPRERLEVAAPATWKSASSGSDGTISSGWLAEFGDTAMRQAVEEALSHNQDLKAASARMRQ